MKSKRKPVMTSSVSYVKVSSSKYTLLTTWILIGYRDQIRTLFCIWVQDLELSQRFTQCWATNTLGSSQNDLSNLPTGKNVIRSNRSWKQVKAEKRDLSTHTPASTGWCFRIRTDLTPSKLYVYTIKNIEHDGLKAPRRLKKSSYKCGNVWYSYITPPPWTHYFYFKISPELVAKRIYRLPNCHTIQSTNSIRKSLFLR